jgi:hypothetical protein
MVGGSVAVGDKVSVGGTVAVGKGSVGRTETVDVAEGRGVVVDETSVAVGRGFNGASVPVGAAVAIWRRAGSVAVDGAVPRAIPD